LLALEADEDSEMSWDSESPDKSREVAEHWKERRDEDAKDNTSEPNDRKILGAQFTKEDFEARKAWIQRAYTKSISIVMEDQKDDEDRWQAHLQELNKTKPGVARGRKAHSMREEPAPANENSPHVRAVSPPKEKVEEKPVKGILRPPREKFPEYTAPICRAPPP